MRNIDEREHYIIDLFERTGCFLLSTTKLAQEIPRGKDWLYEMRDQCFGPKFYKEVSSRNGQIRYRIDHIADYFVGTDENANTRELLRKLLLNKHERTILSRKEVARILGSSTSWLDKKSSLGKNSVGTYTISSVLDYVLNLNFTKTI